MSIVAKWSPISATAELVTFRVSRRQHEMYSGHGRLCVYLSVSLATFSHYCTDPDVTLGSGRGCPLVVHLWADLQSVHRFCWYDNIVANAKCQRVLVLAHVPGGFIISYFYSVPQCSQIRRISVRCLSVRLFVCHMPVV